MGVVLNNECLLPVFIVLFTYMMNTIVILSLYWIL